jgi:exo-1,4-beta-D-glucosaminidase
MRDNVASLDGTRPFIPCSSGFSKAPETWKGSWPDDRPAGVYSGGPYAWVGEQQYYRLADEGKDWVFKDETGIPSQPPYNSLIKIIPDLIPDSTLPYPLNNSWGYHDACSGNGKYDVYLRTMQQRYGKPDDLRDFSEKMQLMNASGYRAIFESVGRKLNETGGVMLWKLNAAFPSVVWQIYDWYLEPNAGYYFMQNALEPVHVQWNYDDSSVVVVNRSYSDSKNITVHAQLFNLDGRSSYQQSAKISAGPVSVAAGFSLKEALRQSRGISWIVLDLKDGQDHIVSRNTYWLSAGDDFMTLKNLPAAQVELRVLGSVKKGSENRWTMEVVNKSDRLAFFINPQLWNDREEIMPTWWSANYFSLPPGEKIRVTASCPTALISGKPMVKLDGWNVKALQVPLATLR